MKIKEFLLDKLYFAVFFIILITFISMVIGEWDKIIYILTVSIIFTPIYLLLEYMKNYKFFNQLDDVLNNSTDKLELIHTYLHPNTQEQILYVQSMEKINKNQQIQMSKFEKHKKEYEEYVETWVHEIKTPIASAHLMVEKDPFDENLISIEEDLDEIEQYVEQALYYAKKDSVAKDYFIKEVSLQRIITNVLKKRSKQFIDKNISVEMNGLEHNVLTDSKWIEFIVDQIIQNSIKYVNKEKGMLKIYTVNNNNKQTNLVIEDNGIGIKEEDLSRVFDKGFTGQTGRKFKKSTQV